MKRKYRQNLLAGANRYVTMTTPYLIIDNDLCTSIENAALRGVKVTIILPHIPDKKLVFGMTRSFYPRLMAAGVEIYEYEPGLIHAKSYLADDELAMIGTINLDYRSPVHHFENGVRMYRCAAITDLKRYPNHARGSGWSGGKSRMHDRRFLAHPRGAGKNRDPLRHCARRQSKRLG